LPEGEGATDRDTDPKNGEDGRGVFCGETVPEADDVPAVVDAKPRCDCVAQTSADGEGDHESFARHLEHAGG
jgi:hypothetical protein